MSKTLEEIKEGYAINLAGYSTWDELIYDEPSYRVEIHTDQVAELYAQSQTQELVEQNRELIEALQNVVNLLDSDSKISVESIKRVLTKYQKS